MSLAHVEEVLEQEIGRLQQALRLLRDEKEYEPKSYGMSIIGQGNRFAITDALRRRAVENEMKLAKSILPSRISDVGRARIAAAQKKRWAAVRKARRLAEQGITS